MIIVIATILLLAIIGGGIYLWVKRARKNLLAKKTKQATSSKLQEEAQPSILDTVVSPVTDPTTSSTFSGHPQINASTEARDGNGEKAADGTSAPQTTPPQSEDLSQSKYAARFRHAAPAIKDLAEKLLTAWNKASAALSAEEWAWLEVKTYRRTVYVGNDCRFIDSPAEIGEFITNLNQHFAKELKQYKQWLATATQVHPATQEASQAFEALRQALRPFPLDNITYLPADLQIICNSAHRVLDTSRDSIEKKLKRAAEIVKTLEKEELAGKPVKHDRARLLHDANDASFAEGTDDADKRDTEEGREALIRAAYTAVEKRFALDTAYAGARTIFGDLETLAGQNFTFPKKPTPEEITRFLSEVEDWQKRTVASARQLKPALAEVKTAMAALREAVQSLKRTRGRTTPVLTDTRRTIDDGLVMAVSKIVDDLEKMIQSQTEEVAKLTEKAPKVSEPQPRVTSEEEAAIKTLRTTMRTVAFALAQRAVATAKLAQIQRQEPSVSGFAPRVERSQSFETYLEKYGEYHSTRAKQQAEHDQWAQNLDTVQMAYGARNNKVTESSQALAAKLAEVNKALGSDTADELQVVSGMSAKIVQLTGNNQ